MPIQTQQLVPTPVIRHFLPLVALCLAMVIGCRRPAEPRPAQPATSGVAPVTPVVKKTSPSTVADLIEKFQSDRKPPAISSEDILQPYDDGRTVGDRIYKGVYVWMTGPIAKIEASRGKRILYVRDQHKRAIAIRAEFVDEDQPLLQALKKDDIVTIWGRMRGMPAKDVLLDNGILLTDDRQAAIAAAMKK